VFPALIFLAAVLAGGHLISGVHRRLHVIPQLLWISGYELMRLMILVSGNAPKRHLSMTKGEPCKEAEGKGECFLGDSSAGAT
jgi:hypothetical protein